MKRILNTTMVLATVASMGLPYSTAFAASTKKAQAQQAQTPVVGGMTLQQVLEYVHQNSPEMGIQQSKVREAGYAIDEVKAKLGFQVTAEANAGVFYNSFGGGENGNHSSSGVAVNAFVEATKIIYDGGLVKAQANAKKITQDIIRQESYLTQADVLSLTIQSYVNVVVRKKILDERAKIIGGLGSVSAAARTAFNIGLASATDSLQANTAVSQVQIEALKAERDYEQAKIAFTKITKIDANLIGQDLTALVPFFDQFAAGVPQTLSDAQDAARMNNPKGRIAALQNALADANVTAVKKESSPEVSLVGRIGLGNDDTVGAEGNNRNKIGAAAYAGVRVKYNLYDGGGQEARLGQAREQGIQARYAQIISTSDVNAQTAGAWYDYATYSNRLTDLVKKELSAANGQLAQVSDEYKSGLRTMVELIAATVLPGRAKIELLEAQQITLISRVQVMQAIGALTAETLNLSGGTFAPVAPASEIQDVLTVAPSASDAATVSVPRKK